jgi:hypothetical protein
MGSKRRMGNQGGIQVHSRAGKGRGRVVRIKGVLNYGHVSVDPFGNCKKTVSKVETFECDFPDAEQGKGRIMTSINIKETVEMLREVEEDFSSARPSIVGLTSDAAALIERLAGALEPFANAGSMEIKGNGMVNVLLFIEDIERARRALSGEPTQS